ncbi:MAG: response regulator [Thermoanaerobaculia bacterium]
MPKKILLADDSITIQKVVELTFSDGDYEVIATSNGARAIQKLSEIHPDIILSDIIMPEKNGYELCEYVKSHPEYRNIPVILLTGTFEPFDPDRAEKAGCDAVVTKPFESQSLVHKVEELIQQAGARGESREEEPAATASAEPEQNVWDFPAEPASPSEMPPRFERETPPAPSSFEQAEPAEEPGEDTVPPFDEPFKEHGSEIFQESAAAPSEEMPLDEGFDYSGETRTFQKMSLSDLQSMQEQPEETGQAQPPEPPQFESEGGGFGEEAPPAYGGETRAFQMMSPEELQRIQQEEEQREAEISAGSPFEQEEPPQSPTEPAAEHAAPSPFEEPPESVEEQPASQQMSGEAFGVMHEPEPAEEVPAGETRAFPMMSFDEIQRMQGSMPPAADETEEQPIPQWEQPEEEKEPAGPWAGAEAENESPQPWGAEEPASASPWESEPAPAAEEEASPWEAPAEQEQAWGSPLKTTETPFGEEAPAEEEPEAPAMEAPQPSPFEAEVAAAPDVEEEQTRAPEEELPSEPALSPFEAAEVEEPPAAQEEYRQEPEYPTPPPPMPVATPAPVAAAPAEIQPAGSDLTDEQIERIAKRVVEKLSDQVVRNIAWEVIPDLAEIIVKERIRELEGE